MSKSSATSPALLNELLHSYPKLITFSRPPRGASRLIVEDDSEGATATAKLV